MESDFSTGLGAVRSRKVSADRHQNVLACLPTPAQAIVTMVGGRSDCCEQRLTCECCNCSRRDLGVMAIMCTRSLTIPTAITSSSGDLLVASQRGFNVHPYLQRSHVDNCQTQHCYRKEESSVPRYYSDTIPDCTGDSN